MSGIRSQSAVDSNAVDVTTALYSEAWLIWRDFLYGKDTQVDVEKYIDQESDRLYQWLKGNERPITEYCACYEQVCDFSNEVGALGTVKMMKEIISKLETMDTVDGYDKRISDLLRKFNLEDNQETRMNMERIYAASVCYAQYQKMLADALAQSMLKGESIVDADYTAIVESIGGLYRNVIEHARKTPTPFLLVSPRAQPPASTSEAFRKAELRRKSTRHNLTELQQQMILMHKEELDPAKKKKKRTKHKRRQKNDKKNKKKTPKAKSEATNAMLNKTVSSGWSRPRFGSFSGRKKTHKRSYTETGEARLTGFNLSEGAIETAYGSASRPYQPDEGSSEESSTSTKETAVAEEPSPVMDDVFFKHMARHFVKSVWSHLKRTERTEGVSGFLSKYSFPRFTLATSQDMRFEEICDALGEYGKKNFIRQIVTMVAKDGAVDEEIAHIRDVVMDQKPWRESCDQHVTMAALFWRCSKEFNIKYGYLLNEHAKRLGPIAANSELRDLHYAIKCAQEEFDEAIFDLRQEYLGRQVDSSNFGALERSWDHGTLDE